MAGMHQFTFFKKKKKAEGKTRAIQLLILLPFGCHKVDISFLFISREPNRKSFEYLIATR
jgi:hypothetical protein